VNAVLDDNSLPFDRKKVAMGRASAGANLSLAVTQDESLQGRIGGVVLGCKPTRRVGPWVSGYPPHGSGLPSLWGPIGPISLSEDPN
jgi:hypothetical protein